MPPNACPLGCDVGQGLSLLVHLGCSLRAIGSTQYICVGLALLDLFRIISQLSRLLLALANASILVALLLGVIASLERQAQVGAIASIVVSRSSIAHLGLLAGVLDSR